MSPVTVATAPFLTVACDKRELMVGCMAGSSLGMAPAFVIGQLCSVIDLDGPSVAASDVPHPILYVGNQIRVPPVGLWG